MDANEQLAATLKLLSGDFDAMNFEAAVGSFDAEHFNLNISDPNAIKQYLAQQHQVMINMAKKTAQNRSLGSNDSGTITALKKNAVGIANLKVIRGTANIAAALPYVLFGQTALNGNFSSILKPFIPAVVTSYTTSIDPATGDLLFTYNAASGTDIVRVTFQGLTTYSDMLQNSSTTYFSSAYTLYTVNDYTNGQSQFKNQILFGALSTLGKKDQNQLPIDAMIDTWDFRYDRANLLYPDQKMTNQFAFIDNIIPCPTPDLFTSGGSGFIVTWNMFMSHKYGYGA